MTNTHPNQQINYVPLRLPQRQLDALERGGILVSRLVGRTRMYTFNPRYALLDEVRALLEKAIAFYPPEEQDRLLLSRQRPRRAGKPL